MMIIPPIPSNLAYTGSGPTYVSAAWVTATAYAKNDVRRYQVSSIWYDYKCLRSHISSASITPTYGYYWSLIGTAATSGGYTYSTNVRLSNSANWASGYPVYAWSTHHDEANHRDYQATVAISAGDNTTRPSLAVTSSDEAIAARWVDLGPANAWAPFDQEIITRLQGYDPSGNLIDPVFTFTTVVTIPANQLFLSGLIGVKTVSALIKVNGVTQQTVTAALDDPGTFSMTRRNAILPFTYVTTGNTLTITVTLTRMTSTFLAQCGVCGVGFGYELAQTEWGVETSIIDFSRKERDDTFGTVTFLRRGSAKLVRATCYIDPTVVSGDIVQLFLANNTGVPVMMDFNNPGSDYDRLRLFGFYANLRQVISAASYETLSMDVEGLVD